MKKTDFITGVAEKAKLTKKDAGIALEAVLEQLKETLSNGESISFVGFGTFSVALRAARKARVPGTSKVIDVAARKSVKFKIGKTLKDSVASAK